MPKVSVVVPFFNSRDYLERCLNSLVGQTLRDIEIVLVNDGSLDGSLDIAEQFAKNDSRIKIVSQKNAGLSCARNAGVENASGEYIGLVDSDDFVDKDFFEKLYEVAQKSGADIVCAGMVRENEKKRKILLSYKEILFASEIEKKLELAGVPDHNYSCNKLYSAKLIKETKFKEQVLYEDMFFTSQIIEKSALLAVVPNVFYHYWKHSGTLVKIDSDKARFDKFLAHKFLNEICEKYKLKNSKDYEYKEDIVLFGINVLRIYQYKMTTKYYLFGTIKVAQKTRRV